MEGSESEAIFDSLNLNPQFFLNEVLNTVDDLFLETFDFFYQEASTKINAEATQRSQHLRQGVDCIQHKVQSVLDQKLAAWEKYCIRHCFSVPHGFHMPNTLNEESSKNDIDPSAPLDSDLDAQLDSLRKKLAEVGKESEMLNQEYQALERQSSLNARYINEAVKPYEQNNYRELFQEIVATTSELRMKLRKLNTDMIEETEQIKTKKMGSAEVDLSAISPAKRFSNVTLEDIQEFATLLKTGSNSQTPSRDFSSLTAEKLRSLLRAKGLSAKGKKVELIARLKDADG